MTNKTMTFRRVDGKLEKGIITQNMALEYAKTVLELPKKKEQNAQVKGA